MSWPTKVSYFLKNLPYTPMGRAAIEVFFALIFTFMPIVLLSIPFRSSTGELTRSAMESRFVSFFQSGEIVLPILAICGSIAAITAVNHRSISKFLHVICWACLLSAAIGSGFALAQTDGFSAELYPQIIEAGFIIYGFLLALWFVTAVRAYSSEKLPDPEDRVKELVNALKRSDKGDAI